MHAPRRSSLRLLAAFVALQLLSRTEGFTGVQSHHDRRPSVLPTVASPAAVAPPSITPLSATTAASLEADKPRRRQVLRAIRRTVVGVVTAASFRQQSSKRSIAPPAEADPITTETTGNVVEIEVGNLFGATGGGTIKIQLYPEWAPVGTKRFEELVSQAFFDNARVFRVVPGVLAQFGIHGDPSVQSKWRSASIPDDPVRVSNTRGTLVFCKTAPGTTNTGRTSQVVINTGDNTFLDQSGFSPFGRVIEGMDLVDRFFAGYHGNEPHPGMIQAKGDEYLRPNFPKLSYISKATIIRKDEDSDAPRV